MGFRDLSFPGFKDGRDQDPFLEEENKNTKNISAPAPPAKNIFDKKADFISLGCSITYGIGVGEGQAWDEIIANKLNLTHASRSVPGGSTVWMINNFFSHVEKYGNLPVPLEIRNAPTKFMKNIGYSKGYKYEHSVDAIKTDQEYMPTKLKGKKYLK